MTNFDPIPAIEQLGYTPREAAFIYLVGRNSGYFLARQFNWFLRRKKGALSQGFVDKLRERDHASAIDYGQTRFVYHLKSKSIYRLLGIENSQNRRVKGDHEIRLRLMILDYLMERIDSRILSTEAEKVEFFLSQDGLTTADLPGTVFQPSTMNGEPTARYFIERYPIIVRSDHIEFTYFDEGEFTTKSFVGYLNRYRTLMTKLPALKLIYLALNASNFASAGREFQHFCGQPEDNNGLLPYGAEHLERFLHAQQLWDTNSPDFRPEHLAVLREGERIYTRPEHKQLRDAGPAGSASFAQRLGQLTGANGGKRIFMTSLLEQQYPIFGYKNRGSWEGNRGSVLGSAVGSI